ncbi:hypothetical protein [Variovorax paradoxus]|uniref:hypothetical protein n=1 Tax=Variovorax paradoxus TaxID=34073 RepID=UPI003D65F4FB
MSPTQAPDASPLSEFEELLKGSKKPPFTVWEFRLWLTATGRNEHAKWDSELSKKGRARRNVSMKFLRDKPAAQWSRPEASPLGDHVYVIRFKDENGTQHRLFGYHDLDHHAYVICFEGFEKDHVYHPPNYEERVRKCRSDIKGQFDQRTIVCPWPVI